MDASDLDIDPSCRQAGVNEAKAEKADGNTIALTVSGIGARLRARDRAHAVAFALRTQVWTTAV